MNTPLHEEARAYGIDPIKYESVEAMEKDVLVQRRARQAVHAPQQPDVDSGNAEEAPLPGAVHESIVRENAVHSPPKAKRSPRLQNSVQGFKLGKKNR